MFIFVTRREISRRLEITSPYFSFLRFFNFFFVFMGFKYLNFKIMVFDGCIIQMNKESRYLTTMSAFVNILNIIFIFFINWYFRFLKNVVYNVKTAQESLIKNNTNIIPQPYIYQRHWKNRRNENFCVKSCTGCRMKEVGQWHASKVLSCLIYANILVKLSQKKKNFSRSLQ